MNCSRCKTVELIRVEDSPYNLYPLGKARPKPVDRCPSCGLEWPVKPLKSVIPVPKVCGQPGHGKSMTAAEYLQKRQLLQVDLFSPVVGGFAAE